MLEGLSDIHLRVASTPEAVWLYENWSVLFGPEAISHLKELDTEEHYILHQFQCVYDIGLAWILCQVQTIRDEALLDKIVGNWDIVAIDLNRFVKIGPNTSFVDDWLIEGVKKKESQNIKGEQELVSEVEDGKRHI